MGDSKDVRFYIIEIIFSNVSWSRDRWVGPGKLFDSDMILPPDDYKFREAAESITNTGDAVRKLFVCALTILYRSGSKDYTINMTTTTLKLMKFSQNFHKNS